MKYVEVSGYGVPVVELTERNLRSLLEKLGDLNSQRTLIDPENKIAVQAVYDIEHYADRAPGVTLTNGIVG